MKKEKTIKNTEKITGKPQLKNAEYPNLNVGNEGNKGGTGRPPDALREFCRNLSMSPKILKFVQDVLEGNPIEEKTLLGLGSEEGAKEIKALVTASVKDRQAMLEKVWDRAEGKVGAKEPQMNFIIDFTQRVTYAVSRAIPDQCPHCKHELPIRENTIKELENVSKEIEALKVA